MASFLIQRPILNSTRTLLFAQVLLDVPHALLLITSRDAFPEITSGQVDGFSLVNCNLSRMSDASAQQLVRAICACNPCKVLWNGLVCSP